MYTQLHISLLPIIYTQETVMARVEWLSSFWLQDIPHIYISLLPFMYTQEWRGFCLSGCKTYHRYTFHHGESGEAFVFLAARHTTDIHFIMARVE